MVAKPVPGISYAVAPRPAAQTRHHQKRSMELSDVVERQVTNRVRDTRCLPTPSAMSVLPLTFLYPSAVEDVDFISYGAKCAKIARHSPCASCDCEGLHPPPGWRAISDDSEDVADVLDAAGSSDALTDEGHLSYCDCTHSYEDHGCDESVDRAELSRRARVAVRIDQLLQVNRENPAY